MFRGRRESCIGEHYSDYAVELDTACTTCKSVGEVCIYVVKHFVKLVTLVVLSLRFVSLDKGTIFVPLYKGLTCRVQS